MPHERKVLKQIRCHTGHRRRKSEQTSRGVANFVVDPHVCIYSARSCALTDIFLSSKPLSQFMFNLILKHSIPDFKSLQSRMANITYMIECDNRQERYKVLMKSPLKSR